jgi:hypothetical protein
MKIKLTSPKNYPNFTGIAKRFKDLDYGIKNSSTSNIVAWSGEEVFIDTGLPFWRFLVQHEYEIVEEDKP